MHNKIIIQLLAQEIRCFKTELSLTSSTHSRSVCLTMRLSDTQDLSTSVLAVQMKPICNQECPNTECKGRQTRRKLTLTY